MGRGNFVTLEGFIKTKPIDLKKEGVGFDLETTESVFSVVCPKGTLARALLNMEAIGIKASVFGSLKTMSGKIKVVADKLTLDFT